MGSKAPQYPPTKDNVLITSTKPQLPEGVIIKEGSLRPNPPPAPPPKKYDKDLLIARLTNQVGESLVQYMKLLNENKELQEKYDKLSKAVDDILGYDLIEEDAECPFCLNRITSLSDHSDNCPWKKLQDICNDKRF